MPLPDSTQKLNTACISPTLHMPDSACFPYNFELEQYGVTCTIEVDLVNQLFKLAVQGWYFYDLPWRPCPINVDDPLSAEGEEEAKIERKLTGFIQLNGKYLLGMDYH